MKGETMIPIEEGKKYILLHVCKYSELEAMQPNRRVSKDGTEVHHSFIALVNHVEDRGEFWYISYIPDDLHCKFGYTRVYKEREAERKHYGTRILAEVLS